MVVHLQSACPGPGWGGGNGASSSRKHRAGARAARLPPAEAGAGRWLRERLRNLPPASSSGRPGLVAASPPEPVRGGLPQRLGARLHGGFLRARGFPGDVAVGGSVARMQPMAKAEFWYLLGNSCLLVCEEL